MTFFIWIKRKKGKGHTVYNGNVWNLLTMFVVIGNIVIEEMKKETRTEENELKNFLIDSLASGLDSLWEENNDTD